MLSTPSASTSTPPCRWKYDVFLSFRGEDTRLNFVDHLYAALHRTGIVTFRDDKSLERGKSISSELFKVIEESKFAIVILSPNYANSSWCLNELLEIIQCREEKGQVVIPVFYGVDPSHVRNNKEHFLKAVTEHEVVHRENRDKVRKWSAALTEVANLSGWHLKNEREAEFINRIVKDILDKSQYTSTSIYKGMVGMDSRVDDLLSNHIRPGFDDVRMIGIHGMQGIGKTAVARAVYDQLCQDFDSSYEPSNVGELFRKSGKDTSQYQKVEGFERCCFLSNVREMSHRNGLVSLQQKLLSKILMVPISYIDDEYDGANMIKSRLGNMRVLVVIDDVDHVAQLEYLAGNRDWFGPGSRIIITSFNAHLLNDVDTIYEASLLTYDEALQLLCLKAFNKNQPPEIFSELSRDILGYSQGLPLAIVVIGSCLRGKSTKEWASAIDRLKRRPKREIIDVLQISFDGLEPEDKDIFLHIACFYKGKDRDRVVEILDYFQLNPVIGLSDLADRSLITVSDNELSMHSLLQEMGWEIVRRESSNDPGKRSRLWFPEDIHETLKRNKGTEAVQAMVLDLPKLEEAHWNPEAFSNMSQLNLLQIRNVDLPNGLNCLSNSLKELKLLEWSGYPLRSLPQDFGQDELIELSLCHSKIEKLWEGAKNFDKLKFIRLCQSQNIIQTPDLTGAYSLEKLDLEGCINLVRVDPSLGTLKRLIVLNLKGCVSLESLPDTIEMESLETLILSGCSKIKKIPEFSGNMKCLSELYLDGTAIEDLPMSIERLSGLSSSDLSNCRSLGFPWITIIAWAQENDGSKSADTDSDTDLSFFNILEQVTQDSLTHTGRGYLRSCGLGNLTDLNISYCDLDDGAFRGFCWPTSLSECPLPVAIKCRPTIIKGHAARGFLRLCGLGNLTDLNISYCDLDDGAFRGFCWPTSLSECPLPVAIKCPPTIIKGHVARGFLRLCGLGNLTDLNISNCNLDDGAFRGFCWPTSLVALNLSGNDIRELPEGIRSLLKLEKINLENCKRLENLYNLPSSCKLDVRADGCSSLKILFDVRVHTRLETSYFSFINCWGLRARSIYQALKRQVINKTETFQIVFPGYGMIPRWFTRGGRVGGSSVFIYNMGPLRYSSRLVGFALCAHFLIHRHEADERHVVHELPTQYFRTCKATHHLACYLKVNGIDLEVCGKQPAYRFNEDYGLFKIPHRWLFYVASDKYFGIQEHDSCSEVEVMFETRGRGLEVTECGLRLIFENDVHEWNNCTACTAEYESEDPFPNPCQICETHDFSRD